MTDQPNWEPELDQGGRPRVTPGSVPTMSDQITAVRAAMKASRDRERWLRDRIRDLENRLNDARGETNRLGRLFDEFRDAQLAHLRAEASDGH